MRTAALINSPKSRLSQEACHNYQSIATSPMNEALHYIRVKRQEDQNINWSQERGPAVIFGNTSIQAELQKNDQNQSLQQHLENQNYDQTMNKADTMRLQQTMLKSKAYSSDRANNMRKIKGNGTYAPTTFQTNGMVLKQQLHGKKSNGNTDSSSLLVNNQAQDPSIAQSKAVAAIRRRGERVSSNMLASSGSRKGEAFSNSQNNQTQQQNTHIRQMTIGPEQINQTGQKQKIVEVFPANSQQKLVNSEVGTRVDSAGGHMPVQLNLTSTGQYYAIQGGQNLTKSPQDNFGIIRMAQPQLHTPNYANQYQQHGVQIQLNSAQLQQQAKNNKNIKTTTNRVQQLQRNNKYFQSPQKSLANTPKILSLGQGGLPQLPQAPEGQTAVLLPASQVFQNSPHAGQVPQNGYILGYINSLQASQAQQILIPTMNQGQQQFQIPQQQQAMQTSREMYKQRHKNTPNEFTSINETQIMQMQNYATSPKEVAQSQRFHPGLADIDTPTQTKVVLAKNFSNSKAEQHLAFQEESAGDGITVKGTGVSMQNERSPTEMLRKVVRLRSQQKQYSVYQQNSPQTQSSRQSRYAPSNNCLRTEKSNQPSYLHQQNMTFQGIQSPVVMPGSNIQHGIDDQQSIDQQLLFQQNNHQNFSQYDSQPLYQHTATHATQSSPRSLVLLAVMPNQEHQAPLTVENSETSEVALQEMSIAEKISQPTPRKFQAKAVSRKKRKPSQPQMIVDSQLLSAQSAANNCLIAQGFMPTVNLHNATNRSGHKPILRSNTSSVQPRMRQKVAQQNNPDKQAETGNKSQLTTLEGKETAIIIPPCVIVQTTKPQSVTRLAKELERMEEVICEAEKFESQARSTLNQKSCKPPPINTTLNLKEHPINVVLRKSNEFITETFQKPYDNKIDFKKVQQLCNFFKIAIPSRFSTDIKKLKSREFQIASKERILICLYETINKENGMIKPDAPSAASAQSKLADFHGDQTSAPVFGATFGAPKEEKPEQPSQFLVNPYTPNSRKFYIGKGNNHQIVRIVFKQRWWWQMTTKTLTATVNPASFDTNHFLWTQWRKDHLIDQLATFKKRCVQTKKNETLTVNASIDTEDKNAQEKMCLYAKMEANYHLSNKKALFWNMTNYYKKIGQDPFERLPLTFHVESGLNDPEFANFKNFYQRCEFEKKRKTEMLNAAIKEAKKALKRQNKSKEVQEKAQSNQTVKKGETIQSTISAVTQPTVHFSRSNNTQIPNDQSFMYEPYDPENLTYFEDEAVQQRYGIKIARNIWILKPGENSNRGCGINVAQSLSEITCEVRNTERSDRTLIIQKYIDRPLLFAGRKFDIRIFSVLASINSQIKGYLYTDGYLRTSSKEFSLDNLGSRLTHLTNDAIQQNAEDYGKFESGNKISFQQFQRYLDVAFPEKKINFNKHIFPQIKRLVTDSIYATFTKVDPHRRQHSFEIFGYDFMIDQNFRVQIIECNTNPSLELSCPLMARIIPAMLDNVFRVVVDPLYPPPDFNMAKKNLMHDILPINKLELIFDERLSGEHLRRIFKGEPKINLKIVDDEGAQDQDEIEEVSESENELDDLQNGVNGGASVDSASGGSARSM